MTIVHPGTSDLSQRAWDRLAAARIDARFTIDHVAITAFDEGCWQTLRLLPLTGAGRQTDA